MIAARRRAFPRRELRPPGPRHTPIAVNVPVSATLAANEAMAARRNRGQPVLPLAFGEAGLPVHPALRDALAAATACNGYGPVAGHPALRSAAAGYWQRRGLPTTGSVICGPGSKPLLFGLLLAIGGDVAIPWPSWVSYAAQATIIGVRPHLCLPRQERAGSATRPPWPRRSRRPRPRPPDPVGGGDTPRQPDRPGAHPSHHPGALRGSGRATTLIIICDEIYRDLVHDTATPILSPAEVAPQQTVLTTGPSKSLALGGWRIGVARMPDGPLGSQLRQALLGVGSEIWSAPAAPIQQAAALAFSEPSRDLRANRRSRALHATVARAVASICAAAGLLVPRRRPRSTSTQTSNHGVITYGAATRVTTSAGLARLLLERYGAATLPASAFGENPGTLQAPAGHRADLRGQRDAARSSAHRPRPASPAMDRRCPGTS